MQNLKKKKKSYPSIPPPPPFPFSTMYGLVDMS